MTNPWILSLLVGIGGFAGSVARYSLSIALLRFSIEWPIGTLTSNILGCLVIGIITGLSARGDFVSPAVRLALGTGFCGGFTTLSSMVYETAEMIRASEYLHATIYTASTFLFSMTAFIAGVLAVSIIIKMGG